MDQLNVEFTKTKMGLTEVVEHGKVDFTKMRSRLAGHLRQCCHRRSTKWARGSTGLRRPRRGQNKGLHSDQEPDPQGVQGPW